jgi:hypothetical protein
MKLSLEIVNQHSACSSGVEWYENNGNPNSVESCVDKLLSDDKCSEAHNWANWLLAEMLEPNDKIRYAIFAAELVIDIFEKAIFGDERPRKAIDAAKKYLKLKTPAARAAAWAAWDAAGAAAGAAWAARAAAWAAWAAGAARDAAMAALAAGAAAGAAWDAAWAAWAVGAAGAAWAAWAAAGAAGAAGDAAYKDMLGKIIKYGVSLINKGKSNNAD